MKDLNNLNIDLPEIICNATDNIPEMITFVKELMSNGYAYETSTAIYFDVAKLERYGILSGINLKEQLSGARVEVDNEKKNPYDFALWIKAPENHLMKWDSEWGPSYPGWHIECSAMGKKFLGEQFDIHTGGIDLIPTHHENEIAQCVGNCGKIPANYWLHGEYLLIDGGKMSKSLNNVYLLQDIIERGYSPLAYKLFCFTSHYRNKINFTWDAIHGSDVALKRLRAGYQKHLSATETVGADSISAHFERITTYKEKFLNAINDDLNMPEAMSIVWEVVKQDSNKKYAELLLDFDKVMGLDIDKVDDAKEISKEIEELINQRNIARENKDWKESDRLRDLIEEKGYKIKDTSNGTIIEV
jgi:cysteinyl-tRNA synthetase